MEDPQSPSRQISALDPSHPSIKVQKSNFPKLVGLLGHLLIVLICPFPMMGRFRCRSLPWVASQFLVLCIICHESGEKAVITKLFKRTCLPAHLKVGGDGRGGKDGAECDAEQMQERMQMRNTCARGAWPGIVADLCASLSVCADSI